MSIYVICNQCGGHFDFIAGFDESMLCPVCEANDWNYDVPEEEKTQLRHKTKLKERTKRGEKPFRETTIGEELFKETNQWRHIIRIVNHKDNVYYEKISDYETGEVIKEFSEKLSEHQGHGADKKDF
jgi:hypothetical protein